MHEEKSENKYIHGRTKESVRKHASNQMSIIMYLFYIHNILCFTIIFMNFCEIYVEISTVSTTIKGWDIEVYAMYLPCTPVFALIQCNAMKPKGNEAKKGVTKYERGSKWLRQREKKMWIQTEERDTRTYSKGKHLAFWFITIIIGQTMFVGLGCMD